MKLFTAAFYIFIIVIIAKCSNGQTSGFKSNEKSNPEKGMSKKTYSYEEFSLESDKIFFLDSITDHIVIISSTKNNQPKTLDFLLGNKQNQFLK